MQFSLKDILELRFTLSEEAEVSLPLTYSKCGLLSQVIENTVPGTPEISQRYLYEYLHLRINRALKADETTYGLNVEYVEKLVRFAGYEGVQDWLASRENQKPKPDDQLESLKGMYYCYVMCNSGQPDLLKSPVKIHHNGKHYVVEMRGKVRKFEGVPEIRQGCLFVLLRSDQDKQLHWVCKVGNSRSPEIIQYIFSGVSSGGDPIGGKGLLVKTRLSDMNEGTNEKIPMENLKFSSSEKDLGLFTYFSTANPARMKISSVSTFDFRDIN
ncbi:MAG: hypothetical protein R3D00_24630 [Bacteroidia bacterium]